MSSKPSSASAAKCQWCDGPQGSCECVQIMDEVPPTEAEKSAVEMGPMGPVMDDADVARERVMSSMRPAEERADSGHEPGTHGTGTQRLFAAINLIESYLSTINTNATLVRASEQPAPCVHGQDIDEQQAVEILDRRFGPRPLFIQYSTQTVSRGVKGREYVSDKPWFVGVHGDDLPDKYHCRHFYAASLSEAVRLACDSDIPALQAT
jgi:hypothetical protein